MAHRKNTLIVIAPEPPKSDRAPKNFTEYLSRIEEEGRRNQPRNASPKKTKKRHAETHEKAAELRKEAGALEPFYSPNGVPK